MNPVCEKAVENVRFVVLEGNYALNVDTMEDAKKIAVEMAQKSHDLVKIIRVGEVKRFSDMVCDVYIIDCEGEIRKVSE